MADISMTIVKMLSVVLNAAVLTRCIPRKKPLPVVIAGWAAIALICFAAERFFGILPELTVIGAVLFVPLIFWAYSGKPLQVLYAMILPTFFTLAQQFFVEAILRFIIPYGTDTYWLIYLIAVIVIYGIYIWAVLRFGKRFFDKLFVEGRTSEWALYTFSSLLAFLAMGILYQNLINVNTPLFLLVLCAITWSFIMICFAIINTHEKTKQKYEADLAREIITSGRGYYEKLTDISEELQILRNDYKHHLASMQKMITSGYSKEIQDYLETLNGNIDDRTVNEYSNSRVINSLIDSFSERCKNASVDFNVKIILPPEGTIDDYELCVILGNLLENAITACLRIPVPVETPAPVSSASETFSRDLSAGAAPHEKRYIELTMKPLDNQYGIKVENSFDGVVKNDGKTLYTTKKDGGLGIKSIISVAKNFGGEYVPVWDDKKFSAFVVLKLGEI